MSFDFTQGVELRQASIYLNKYIHMKMAYSKKILHPAKHQSINQGINQHINLILYHLLLSDPKETEYINIQM